MARLATYIKTKRDPFTNPFLLNVFERDETNERLGNMLLLRSLYNTLPVQKQHIEFLAYTAEVTVGSARAALIGHELNNPTMPDSISQDRVCGALFTAIIHLLKEEAIVSFNKKNKERQNG